MHKVDIPDEIRQRVSFRRDGSVSFIDKLNPSKTALLVIDMQNYFWMEDLPVLHTPQTAGIVDNVNSLADAARQTGMPVYWVQHSFTPEWKSWYQKTTKGQVAQAMIENTAPGSKGYAIHDSMNVLPDEVRVHKTRYSTMLPNSSNIDAQLRARGIDTLIITGALTNCCCESTARDAMMMDYDVVFVTDANATRSDAQHNATLVSMMQLFADVRDSASTIDLIARAAEKAA